MNTLHSLLEESQRSSWSEEDLSRMNQVLRHRIRNFVSGLKAAVSFLEQDLKHSLSTAQLEYFPLIIRECDELAECTNRMNLLFDKLHPSEPDSLKNIFAAVIEKIRNKFPALKLEPYISDELMEVILPQKAYVAIGIEEGIINAAEAAPASAIKIVAAKERANISISIIDEGKSAFTEDELEKFFLPFFTTKPRHLGLGLAIARRVMACCGGSVKLFANQDKNGITFKIELLPQTNINPRSSA